MPGVDVKQKATHCNGYLGFLGTQALHEVAIPLECQHMATIRQPV
jgi:hypothetical protein